MSAKIGFGRADLWGTWKSAAPLEDEIEVRAMAVLGEEGSAVLAAADVCGMWPSTCLRLRKAVASAVGCPEEQVGIFCTQNHGAPMEGPGIYDLDQWEDAFVRAAVQAWERARTAWMAYVECVPPVPVFDRRKRFGEMGSFTFYFGFSRLPDGRAGVAQLLELALRGLASGPERTIRSPVPDEDWSPPLQRLPEVPQDAALDRAVDPLLQGIFFRTPEGAPIGSLSRWAAHPITANAIGGGHSGDYPAYVRRRLSERFGGGGLFLTGPCGNQAPLVEVKSRSLAEQTGTRLADALLGGLEQATWQEIGTVRAVSLEVDLPVRKDYPSSLEAARRDLEEAKEEQRRLRADPSASLQALKQVAERIEMLGYVAEGVHYGWCGLSVEELTSGPVQHPLFGLRIGGVVVAGFPGEPFGRYSVRLRESFPDLPLIAVEEANGYLSYIPTADEYPLGGYGPSAALFDPGVEEVLTEAGRALIQRCLG